MYKYICFFVKCSPIISFFFSQFRNIILHGNTQLDSKATVVFLSQRFTFQNTAGMWFSTRGFVFAFWTQQEAGSARLTRSFLPNAANQSMHGQRRRMLDTLWKGETGSFAKIVERSEANNDLWLLRNVDYIYAIQTSQQRCRDVSAVFHGPVSLSGTESPGHKSL